MSQQEGEIGSIQDCIDIVSKKQRYQYLFIAFMSFIWLQITYSAMVGSYVFMNPLFECSGETATQVNACQKIGECKVTNSFTATFYDQLYCERKSTRSAIQSIYALGALIGMFGLPALSDAKGRRFSIILGFVVQIIGILLIIIGVYENISPFMLAGQLLIGIFTSGMVIISYVMTGELCEDSVRQTAIMLYCAVWGLGEISYFFLYNFLPQWYYYLILFILIPSIASTIISVIFIFDTPEYCLVMAKNLGEFNKVIEKIGTFNSASTSDIEAAKAIGDRKLKHIQSEGSSKRATFSQTMKKLINDRPSFVTCICLALSQLAYNIFYYGVQGSLERTGYNFGISMLLIGVHQFFAYLTASYFIKKIKRKKGLVVAIIITSSFGLTFMLDFVRDNQIAQSVVISLTRIGCVYSYSLLSIIQTESFPAQIKSTAIGLTVGLSQLGRIGVPYLVTKMNDAGIHPLIASSAFFLILGIAPLWPVKQTWKKQEKGFQTSESLIESQKSQS